jgi:hypothetical protein
MNAERLLGLLRVLAERESANGVQSKLQALNNSLQLLSQQPQNASFQQAVSRNLGAWEESLFALHDVLTPAQRKGVIEIGGAKWFELDLIDEIQGVITANTMTPAVAHQQVNKLLSDRQTYLDTLISTRTGLQGLTFEEDSLAIGEAEVGFSLPRGLFDNELDGLADELHEIHKVVDLFSEIATGRVDPIEVRQISTSDPTFFLGLDVYTVVAIGASVT